LSKRRDQLVAVGVAVVVVVLVASAVISVLTAERNGRDALEDLELAQLQQQAGGRTDVNQIASVAADALSRSAQPSYLKVGASPVLFVYGTWTLQPSAWQAVMAKLAAQGYHPFVVGDGSDPGFAFDGFHLYNPNGLDATALRTYDWASARRLRIPHVLHPDVPQRLWAATVSPGQNTIGRHGTGAFRSRDGGTRYDQTWRAALASNPDWVLITSWNEWLETTQVAPSQTAGWRALSQTASWSAQFRN